MEEVVLKVEGLCKKYHKGYQPSQIKEVFASFYSSKNQTDYQTGPTDFWALDDVSFELHKGEVLGIIGENGSGKSTLLKIISQITPPTKGNIHFNGRIASILDIGTGFHPELTGRENIYLRGELFGMSKANIDENIATIIDFSEIGSSLDSPVKHYSSGMFLRLAFSVSMFLDSDILLLDEVVSVGDAGFRFKCFRKIDELIKKGVSIILISHNFNEINTLCHRCIWMDKGKIIAQGRTIDIIGQYTTSSISKHLPSNNINPTGNTKRIVPNAAIWEKENRPGNDFFELCAISVSTPNPRKKDILYMDEPLELTIIYRKKKLPLDINFYLSIFNLNNDNGALSTINPNKDISSEIGIYSLTCHIPRNFMNFGNYYISFWVGSDTDEFVDNFQKILFFKVDIIPELEDSKWKNVHASIRPDLEWEWKKLPNEPT